MSAESPGLPSGVNVIVFSAPGRMADCTSMIRTSLSDMFLALNLTPLTTTSMARRPGLPFSIVTSCSSYGIPVKV